MPELVSIALSWRLSRDERAIRSGVRALRFSLRITSGAMQRRSPLCGAVFSCDDQSERRTALLARTPVRTDDEDTLRPAVSTNGVPCRRRGLGADVVGCVRPVDVDGSERR